VILIAMAFDVFIAYTHPDKAFADATCAALEAAGIRCWIAPRDIHPGSDWTETIMDALRASRLMVLIFSSHANKSPYIQREVQRAIEDKKPVLPIRIDDATPKDWSAYCLATVQWLDATSPPLDQHFQRLVKRLKELLNASEYQPSPAIQPSLRTSDKQEPKVSFQPAATHEEANKPAQFSRSSPEYWLSRVAKERKLSFGDQPLILISFASDDQKWVEDLKAFLDPRLEFLQDPGGQPYQLWNFTDAKRGTAPGDEFPEIVAEKMWRCRAALIILSSSYFKSQYCRMIELPFLMWRRDCHGLMCVPLKLGTLPVDKVRLPTYEGTARHVVIGDLIDDRQAAPNFAHSRYRDLSLKQLREEKIESEIENRFEGIARRVIEYLKEKFAATEQ
jgi:hypothetical protein